MTSIDPYTPQETKFRREFLIAAALLAVPLAAVLIGTPQIDLAISSAVRQACPVAPVVQGGPWCPTLAVTAARKVFMGIFLLLAVATLLASVRVFIAQRKWFGFAQARCWFMIAVLIVGPGVVANLVFKENLGRARPRDVVEFGGTKAFTPPLVPASECSRNCSFISGEASSIYASFFALALLLPQYRAALLVGGIAIGTLAGIVRIIQGAHFLSDVLFAGIIMAITVSLLHIAFIGLWRNPRQTWNAITAPFAPVLKVALSRVS
jgi:lipid A 4'-phosphatase